VIPEGFAQLGLTPQDAWVAFHGLDDDRARARVARHRVLDVLWSRPSSTPGLDCTILRLDGYPPGVEPLPVAELAPVLGGEPPQRAYLIGHPKGIETPQFSLQDNAILDRDDRLLHYRSPSEPGSSGSPVFDGQWRLIALHHAGFDSVPRLNGAPGRYAANEGILISAIQHGLRVGPP
jgi:Trypsin-like peptidase domain